MQKKQFTQALTGGLMAIAVLTPAFAAGVVNKPKVMPMQVAGTANRNSARLIVTYRANVVAPTDDARKRSIVEAAAARANLRVSTAAKTTTPMRASKVRALKGGRDLMKLERQLTQAELDKIVAQLKADATVQAVEVDRMMKPTAWWDFNDPFITQQWNLYNANGGIRADVAWDTSKGDGVIVADLDTGVVPHPDLSANLLQGYDFITDSFVSRRATNDRVPGALDYGDYASGNYTETDDCGPYTGPKDSSWHGSHTAGTIAEVGNNGIGSVGVAHNAKVLPVRVLGRCGGYTSDIADAITWASGGTVTGVPNNPTPAEVINLSLGGYGPCETYTQDAINGAVARGTVVVVAAGNSSADASLYSPANCQNVVTVGASRINGGKASYSNYGANVDIAAPGGDPTADGLPNGYILQAGNSSRTAPDLDPITGPAYYYMAGTSMAAPHVSATVALVQSALANAGRAPLTPAEMEALLKRSARAFPVSIPATQTIGVGILDASTALAKALLPPCNPQTQTCLDATELFNNVNLAAQGAPTGGEVLYKFVAQAGVPVSFMTFGGIGDASMYVSFNAAPSAAAYQFRSVRTGNSETIRITAPQAGTYYIKLVGTVSYSGLTIVARQ